MVTYTELKRFSPNSAFLVYVFAIIQSPVSPFTLSVLLLYLSTTPFNMICLLTSTLTVLENSVLGLAPIYRIYFPCHLVYFHHYSEYIGEHKQLFPDKKSRWTLLLLITIVTSATILQPIVTDVVEAMATWCHCRFVMKWGWEYRI